MHYSLISKQANFIRKSTQLIPDKQEARLVRILALGNNQAIIFYNNFWFYHVSLVDIKVIYQSVLEGSVFDAVAVNNERVIIMLNEKKNIVQLNLTTKKVSQIYKITSDSLYHFKQQKQQFFLSRLHPFTQSQTFYLQQNLTNQRKVKIIYFFSNNPTKNHKSFQVRQFEAKNYIYFQLDQTSSIVRFKQNPQQNASFSFEEINLQTNDSIQHKFEWPSFVLYSTVIDVKKFHQEKFLIFLNSKNSSHEVILYNAREKNVRTLCQSTKIYKQCIFINEKLNLCMFSLLYGKTMDSQILRLVDLNSGKVLYETEEKVSHLVVSKSKDFLIEYSVESKVKSSTTFRILSLVDKTVHYLKIMQGLKLNTKYGEQFMNMVAEMLKE